MEDGHEVDDDRLLDPHNKPNAIGETDQPVYEYGWKYNGIYHSSASGCQQDEDKLDGMNKEFISVLTYFTEFLLFLPNFFFVEVIMVETNVGFNGPNID